MGQEAKLSCKLSTRKLTDIWSGSRPFSVAFFCAHYWIYYWEPATKKTYLWDKVSGLRQKLMDSYGYLAQWCEPGTETAWIKPIWHSVLWWNWRDSGKASNAVVLNISVCGVLFQLHPSVHLQKIQLLSWDFFLWRKYLTFLSFSPVLLMCVLEQDGPYSSVNALVLFSWWKWNDSVGRKCLHLALGACAGSGVCSPVSAHSPAFAVLQYFVEDPLGSISSHCVGSLFNLCELAWSVPSGSCGFICKL